MKILVTGGDGQLAFEFKKFSDIIVLNKKELDITSANDIKKNIKKYLPSLIVNAAAYTNVEAAEEEREPACAINTNGAGLLATICRENNVSLIHISTDYVFSGDNETPYNEEDKIDPINVYGVSKANGEELIKKNMHKYIILRVSGVFGVHGKNFVKTILKAANEKETLNVVGDQTISPTGAHNIAAATIEIANFILDKKIIFNSWGVYHYVSVEKISWYDFACDIVARAKNYRSLTVKKINKISSKEFITKAKRPKYSVLNCKKIYDVFGIAQKSYADNLEILIRDFFHDERSRPFQ